MSYRAENNGVVLTIDNVDFTVTSLVTFPVIPPNVSFACIGGLIITNNYTALSGGTITIGTPSGSYSNMFSVSLTSFTGTNQSRQIQVIALSAPVSSGTQIGISVSPLGSPPGPFSGQVSLVGYYY